MIDKQALEALSADIYEKARVDREHLLAFLRLLNTSDARVVADEIRKWLKSLHDDPKYSKIQFPVGDVDAILSDLASYERLRPETLYALQQGTSNRELRA